MLNRPQNAFTEVDPRGTAAWDVDERPNARLRWLLLLMALPIGLITLRLVWVQTQLCGAYLEAFNVTTATFESIAARDGRILSADGRVLADDLQQFNVLVHYRWLQSPADAGWLKQQALARLGREDRKDKERVKAEQERVLAQREALWRRLADLASIDSEKLQASRSGIQQRVERIVSSVEWNRHEQQWAEEHGVVLAGPTDVSGWWNRAWQTAATELTTPPNRESREAIVVREELEYHRLLDNVSLQVAAEIQAHPEDFPGLRVENSSLRIYPQRALAPHLIGSRGTIGEEELARRKERFPEGDPLDYQAGDRIGKSGVERRYDEQIRGVRGSKRIVRDRRGEIVSTDIVREPRTGRDVVLTLELALQQRVEAILDRVLEQNVIEGETEVSDSLRGAGASLVAIDVHTGAVLTAASAPRFDLDLLVHPDKERWQALMDDPRRPFFDRATQMALPPGSVFKPMTAVAFLESGKIDPFDKVPCAGFLDSPQRYRCYIYSHFGVGHGDIDLSDALAASCNVYFFVGARKIGPQPLVAWAERFGFGQLTGIDVPSEQAGHLPRPPAEPAAMTSKKWQPSETLGLAIGQSRLLVTPIQVARMMAAIANGGRLVTPHIIRPDSSSSSTSPADPQAIAELHPDTLVRIREGLEKVVADRKGTANKTVYMKELSIAGKTGTAEVGGGRPDHAWFAGYLPADHPRIAFAVVLEHGGSGGRAAGPVAKEFAQSLLELGILHRQDGAPTKLGNR
jgi:penicillin-binding protein 2